MKGIVFTVFIDFAEQRFGEQLVHEAIVNSNLSSDGADTAVGTYDHGELVSLVAHIGASATVPVRDLLADFGLHLFKSLADRYPALVSRYADSFSLLENIETVIHAQVAKLYLDAELPKFTYERTSPERLNLTYDSARGFGPLVDGLLKGCFSHFSEHVYVARRDLSGGCETHVLFELERKTEVQ